LRGDRVDKVGLLKPTFSKEEMLLGNWKAFVGGLMRAREAWEKFQALRMEMSSLDMLPVDWQEIMTRAPYMSRFEVAVDALMSYWQSQGGMEILLPKEKEEIN